MNELEQRIAEERQLVKQTDQELAALVSLADSGGLRMPLTITTGGTMVSGVLIGAKAFFDELAELVRSAAGSKDALEPLSDTLRRLAPRVSPAPKGSDEDPTDEEVLEYLKDRPRHLHLKGARFLVGSSLVPSGGHLWRCRLSAVEGWSIGSLTIEAAEDSPGNLEGSEIST